MAKLRTGERLEWLLEDLPNGFTRVTSIGSDLVSLFDPSTGERRSGNGRIPQWIRDLVADPSWREARR